MPGCKHPLVWMPFSGSAHSCAPREFNTVIVSDGATLPASGMPANDQPTPYGRELPGTRRRHPLMGPGYRGISTDVCVIGGGIGHRAHFTCAKKATTSSSRQSALPGAPPVKWRLRGHGPARRSKQVKNGLVRKPQEPLQLGLDAVQKVCDLINEHNIDVSWPGNCTGGQAEPRRGTPRRTGAS